MGSNVTQNVSGILNSVFIGYQAGLSNQRGSADNVAIGYQAGRTLSGGSNIVIGSSAGGTLNGNGNILLGTGVDVSGDNLFQVGNASNLLLQGNLSTGQLGIGKAPAGSYALDVSGEGRFTGSLVIEGDLTVSGGPIGSDICTGQIVLGTNVANSNYPSLLCLSGGALFNNGFVAVN